MISLPCTTRSLFLTNLLSVASSGAPSTAQVRANCPALPTTSINSPSVQRNTPAGMPPGDRVVIGPGACEVADVEVRRHGVARCCEFADNVLAGRRGDIDGDRLLVAVAAQIQRVLVVGPALGIPKVRRAEGARVVA